MKKNKNKSIRSKILGKYFRSILIVTVLWIIASFLIFWLFSHYDTNFFIFSLFFYLIFDVIFTLIYLTRTVRFLDKSYQAFSGIISDEYEKPSLPGIIKPLYDKTESNIKNALKYRDYVAQEAEKRKNDLVVYLAHDLKTPLTSIIGYLTLLEEAPELPAEYRAKYTNITLEKAYRLEQLINEFFDITRFNLQSVVLENNHIDLTMMLSQIAEEFYPVLKEKNLICTVAADEKINMVGDADKLSRVFDNLMRNAANYSYPHTEITISAVKSNDKAVITFKNRGDKIPDEKLNMIFEKFFRADNSRTSSTGGAGLGLAIAKQIVEQHGGTITAESDNLFTTFTVMLNL